MTEKSELNIGDKIYTYSFEYSSKGQSYGTVIAWQVMRKVITETRDKPCVQIFVCEADKYGHFWHDNEKELSEDEMGWWWLEEKHASDFLLKRLEETIKLATYHAKYIKEQIDDL